MMEEQTRLPAHIDLEDFAEAITRGALRSLAVQRSEATAKVAGDAPAWLINPIMRLGIWFEITQGEVQGSGRIGGQTGPAGPVGPEGPAM